MAGRENDYFGLSDDRNLPLYSVGIATAGGGAALLSGAALATKRLAPADSLPQPLAGPDVFGISSGAGLEVAIVMLAFGGNIALDDLGGRFSGRCRQLCHRRFPGYPHRSLYRGLWW